MSGPRSIILIGLSGAGKSTVARYVAEMLGCTWCDLDSVIVTKAGKSIAQIFSDNGEAVFRRLESEAMATAVREAPQVIAAGAGWAAQPGALESVNGRSLVIHLAVEPAVAAERLTGSSDRPLLQEDLPARLANQLQDRLKWYNQADLEISANFGAPDVVAAGVVAGARQYGGWAIL